MAETFKPAIFAKLGERITTLIKPPQKLSSAVTFVRSAGENSTSQNSKKSREGHVWEMHQALQKFQPGYAITSWKVYSQFAKVTLKMLASGTHGEKLKKSFL